MQTAIALSSASEPLQSLALMGPPETIQTLTPKHLHLVSTSPQPRQKQLHHHRNTNLPRLKTNQPQTAVGSPMTPGLQTIAWGLGWERKPVVKNCPVTCTSVGIRAWSVNLLPLPLCDARPAGLLRIRWPLATP